MSKIYKETLFAHYKQHEQVANFESYSGMSI